MTVCSLLSAFWPSCLWVKRELGLLEQLVLCQRGARDKNYWPSLSPFLLQNVFQLQLLCSLTLPFIAVLQVNAKLTGKTPLHCAVSAGKTAIVEALLELGANRESEVHTHYTLFFYYQSICVCIEAHSCIIVSGQLLPHVYCRMRLALNHSIIVLRGQYSPLLFVIKHQTYA